MGVTIHSKNYSIDMGSGDFFELRTKIAELTTPDIYEHYKALTNYFACTLEEKKIFFDDYNKKIEMLDKKYNGKYSDILDFLYETDCGGNISNNVCISLWNIIKDYENETIKYGYIGRQTTFNDFKKLVKDCIDNKTNLIWN